MKVYISIVAMDDVLVLCLDYSIRFFILPNLSEYIFKCDIDALYDMELTDDRMPWQEDAAYAVQAETGGVLALGYKDVKPGTSVLDDIAELTRGYKESVQVGDSLDVRYAMLLEALARNGVTWI